LKNTAPEFREGVLNAYRSHLARRYTVENVQRFAGLESFPDGKIEQVRTFFLERLYPPAGERTELKHAFEMLEQVLRSPKKMMHMFGTAIGSVFRLGSLLPAALKAGIATFDGYLEIQRLERIMAESGEPGSNLMEDTVFARIIAAIPETDIQRFRTDLVRLFRALANVKLLEKTQEILESSISVMKSKSSVFDEDDLEGAGTGLALLRDGLEIFRTLTPEEIELLLQGVDQIEMDWISRMQQMGRA